MYSISDAWHRCGDQDRSNEQSAKEATVVARRLRRGRRVARAAETVSVRQRRGSGGGRLSSGRRRGEGGGELWRRQ